MENDTEAHMDTKVASRELVVPSTTGERGFQALRIMGTLWASHACLQHEISSSSSQWCENPWQCICSKTPLGNECAKCLSPRTSSKGVLDTDSGWHYPSYRIGHSAAFRASWRRVCQDNGKCILCGFSVHLKRRFCFSFSLYYFDLSCDWKRLDLMLCHLCGKHVAHLVRRDKLKSVTSSRGLLKLGLVVGSEIICVGAPLFSWILRVWQSSRVLDFLEMMRPLALIVVTDHHLNFIFVLRCHMSLNAVDRWPGVKHGQEHTQPAVKSSESITDTVTMIRESLSKANETHWHVRHRVIFHMLRVKKIHRTYRNWMHVATRA